MTWPPDEQHVVKAGLSTLSALEVHQGLEHLSPLMFCQQPQVGNPRQPGGVDATHQTQEQVKLPSAMLDKTSHATLATLKTKAVSPQNSKRHPIHVHSPCEQEQVTSVKYSWPPLQNSNDIFGQQGRH